MTAEDLTLTVPNETTVVFSGADIKSAIENYSLRYTLRPLRDLWEVFKTMFWNSYYKNIDILNDDLVANYDYTTTTIKTNDDGDTTRTHTPDDTRNYIESSVNSDVSKTVSAGTGNSTPKTDVYSIVYDTEPKHTSYTTQSGETTERTTANANNNKNKTVDNLKNEIINRFKLDEISNKDSNKINDDLIIDDKTIKVEENEEEYNDVESHSTITKTVNGESITSDSIKTEKTTKKGIQNIDKTDIVKNAIELNKISVLNDYITHFIDKFTFYVGGECYDS